MATVATLVLLLMLGGSATTTTTTTPAPNQWSSTADADPKWACPEVSVQANATVQQVVGDWFVLELDGTPAAKPKDACFMFSLTNVTEESANSSSVILTLTRQRNDTSKEIQFRNGGFFLTHAAQEFVVAGLSSVWRLHSLSADGRVLVLAACNIRNHYVYWITVGVAPDALSADVPRRSTNSVRRNANLCRELAETGDSTPSSN